MRAMIVFVLLAGSFAIAPALAAKDGGPDEITVQRKTLLTVGSPQHKAMRDKVAAAIAAGDMSNTADQLETAAGTVRVDFTGHGNSEKAMPNPEHPEIGDSLVYRACANGSMRMWQLTQTRDERASMQGWAVQSYDAHRVDACPKEWPDLPPPKPAP